ncbi:sulfatase-like hydrolase/transferase [Nonomuraea sp. NPDC004580]|uniref:sulfatase family protein n=1 Tax=Nonomuraea sp. NPDC004580 TaxID=3154552 RepID=UPI0033AE4C13
MRGLSRRGVLAAGAAAFAAPAAVRERPFRAARLPERPSRPNILFIFADDLGWADLGCYGAPEIRTPHLDALAGQGVRFTHGYAASAVCSPTRLALYTGRYPGRLEAGLLEPIPGPGAGVGLPVDHPTLASLLKQAGYATAMFGKWHCGFLPDYGPVKSGWDTFFGNMGGAIDYFSKISGNGETDLYEGEVPAESLEYYTRTVSDRAAAFIRDHSEGPWLLNLNYTAPHWPWEGPDDRAVSDDLTRRITEGQEQGQILAHNDGGSLGTYRTMVEAMDAGIGQVLRALADSGRQDDTLVVFSSDNGGERWSYLWPLTGSKGQLNEGGIRVPTIVRWPAAIGGGQVSDVPVVTQDWTATLLEAAGVEPDARYPLDGHSLIPYLLDGAQPPERDLFWRMRRAGALRRGKWKYLRVQDQQTRHLLYDVTADPRERANRAAHEHDLLAQLSAAWDAIDAELEDYPTG